MARRRRRRRRRHRRDSVSESVAVYAKYLTMNGQTASTPGQTKVETFEVTGIVNEGTTNRKIERIRAVGSLSSSITNGSLGVVFGWLAHPGIEPFPTVDDFDPFDTGPSTPGSTTYEGRPSPRPFGRHTTVLAVSGSNAQTLYHDFELGTKAKRLIRPGWKLHLGVWTRSSAGATPWALGIAANVVVAG